MDTLEGYKIIAEFMGGTVTTLDTCANYGHMNIPEWAFREYNFDTMKIGGYDYFESFDWLMPVVEKIGKTIIHKKWLNSGWDLTIYWSIGAVCTSFEIGDHDLHITDSGINPKEYKNTTRPSIERTWKACIEFIQWYNKQKAGE